jgi:hypothetical protein
MSGQNLFCATHRKPARGFFRERIRGGRGRVRCRFYPLSQYLMLQKYLDFRAPVFRVTEIDP